MYCGTGETPATQNPTCLRKLTGIFQAEIEEFAFVEPFVYPSARFIPIHFSVYILRINPVHQLLQRQFLLGFLQFHRAGILHFQFNRVARFPFRRVGHMLRDPHRQAITPSRKLRREPLSRPEFGPGPGTTEPVQQGRTAAVGQAAWHDEITGQPARTH